MLWIVDASNPRPMFAQVADQVRAGIARGELIPGSRLPASRELADSLDVNVHTVLRAYQELHAEGLVDLRRGRGATIRKDVDPVSLLAGDLDLLLERAKALGLSHDDLAALLAERAQRKTDP